MNGDALYQFHVRGYNVTITTSSVVLKGQGLSQVFFRDVQSVYAKDLTVYVTNKSGWGGIYFPCDSQKQAQEIVSWIENAMMGTAARQSEAQRRQQIQAVDAGVAELESARKRRNRYAWWVFWTGLIMTLISIIFHVPSPGAALILISIVWAIFNWICSIADRS